MLYSSAAARPATRRTIAIVAVVGGLLALVLRLYFVTHAQVLQPLYVETGWGDAAEYYRYAWNLVHHGIFSSDAPGSTVPKPDSFRDPAYPIFLAIEMAVIENYDRWYAAVLLSQATLGALTVVAAVLAIRDAIPAWLLAVAATTMAVWPHLVVIPAYVLSENLTALFCAVAALALGEASRRKSMTCTVVGGIALALAALTNAVLAPLFLPLTLAFTWKRVLSRRQLLAFAIVAVAPLLAWQLRNAVTHDTFSPTFRAEVNLVQGSWPTYHAASQLWAKHDPAGTETIEAINFEIAALHTNRTLGLKILAARMSNAPGTYLAWYLSKPALLWGWEIGLGAGDIYVYPTRNSPFVANPILRAVEAVTYIFNDVLALLALVGLIIVARRRDTTAAMLTFAVTAAWVTVVYGVLQSDPRYSIPYRSAEIALACVTVAAIDTYVRTRTKGTEE